MKTTLLLLAASLAASTAHAVDEQIIDLGDGTTVSLKDGGVSVSSSSKNGGNVSNSVSTSTVNGKTESTITTMRDGQQVTRKITIGPDGKAAITDGSGTTNAPSGKLPDPAELLKGGWLGIHTADIPDSIRAQIDLPVGEGILVEFVAAGGPAEKSGLLAHDLLLKLDGQGIKGLEAFRSSLAKTMPGQAVTLDLLRKGKPSTVTATLGPRPPEPKAGKGPSSGSVKGGSSSSSTSSSVIINGQPAQSSRTIIVTNDGQTRVIEGSSGDDPFATILNDPNVPEEMKAQIRKTKADLQKARDKAEKPEASKEPAKPEKSGE